MLFHGATKAGPCIVIREFTHMHGISSIGEGRFQRPFVSSLPAWINRITTLRKQFAPRGHLARYPAPDEREPLAFGQERGPGIRDGRFPSREEPLPLATGRQCRQPLSLVETNNGIN